jgi:hypothetical protein
MDRNAAAVRMALRIFGVFVLSGLAMALVVFGASFVVLLDPLRVHVGMFLAVATWVVVGVFSGRFLIRVLRIPPD